MTITLRFFAGVREAVGVAQETMDSSPQLATVGALRQHLVARGGAWAEALGDRRALRMACNQVMCSADTALTQECEVAFFPPVTGG